MSFQNLGDKGLGLAEPNKHLSESDVDAEVNIGSQTPVLAKSFNLLSACATGITTGNAWAVLGGGIVCRPVMVFTQSTNVGRLRRCIMEARLVSFTNCRSNGVAHIETRLI